MAQQRLDRHQVHATFQEMGRETMAQGVDTFAFFNAAFALGAVINFLGGADVQGFIFALAEKTQETG